PTAGDIFTAAPNAGRVLFTRTNLVPFTVDFSAERLTVNGLGGDDTFNGAAGLAPLTPPRPNGGPGRRPLQRRRRACAADAPRAERRHGQRLAQRGRRPGPDQRR